MKKRRVSFKVTVDIPEGEYVKNVQYYIEAAVSEYKGCLDPELPIYDFDGDSVQVKRLYEPKRKAHG